ncbi:MAG: hypothetical protein Crog4KO_26500 [Crocinitomicaceae bacterium]
MKTIILLPLIILLLIQFDARSNTSNELALWVTIESNDSKPYYVDGAFTSKDPQVLNIIQSYNIYSIEQALPASRMEALQKVYEVKCDCNVDELAGVLEDNPNFSQAERAPVYELLNGTVTTPDDYFLHFSEDYALDLIGAEEAWEYSTGDTSIILGVSDGSFLEQHEDLSNQYISLINNTNAPMYFYYHGTAVSLGVAGSTDNGDGKSAIGFNCKMALNTLGYNQLLQLAHQGARVINASWSSGCFYSPYYQMIINEIHALGTIVVASAGNGGTCGGPTSYVYPAALDKVLAVTSIGPNDNHERTIGDPTTTHQHNDKVDICAPGYDVALSIAPGVYMTGNGTSFAAPYVTGTIGLMLSLRPCLSNEEVIYILKHTAADIYGNNAAYQGQLGSGRLDAGAAMTMVNAFEFCPGDPNNQTVANPPTTVGSGVGVMSANANSAPRGTTTPSITLDQMSTAERAGYSELNTNEPSFEALLYPNPSNGTATIKWNTALDIEVRLLDPAGKLISTKKMSRSTNSTKIDAPDSGVFIVQLVSNDGVVWTERFIKL